MKDNSNNSRARHAYYTGRHVGLVTFYSIVNVIARKVVSAADLIMISPS